MLAMAVVMAAVCLLMPVQQMQLVAVALADIVETEVLLVVSILLVMLDLVAAVEEEEQADRPTLLARAAA